MKPASISALMCAFVRAYHAEQNKVKIFDDNKAKLLFRAGEYEQMANRLSDGISFFEPNFKGSSEEALRLIVSQQLSPLPLGRAAFAERSLQSAAAIGARQYCILGAGYDTFAYRQPSWAKGLYLFELDYPATSEDKQQRLKEAGIPLPPNLQWIPTDLAASGWQIPLLQNSFFSPSQITVCSMLGLLYYLPRQDFCNLLSVLSTLFPTGSSLIFDYPDERCGTAKAGELSQKQAALAKGAKEPMLSGYSYPEMESLLSAHGFLIYEHLTPDEVSAQFFHNYHQANPEQASVRIENANFCLAVRE